MKYKNIQQEHEIEAVRVQSDINLLSTEQPCNKGRTIRKVMGLGGGGGVGQKQKKIIPRKKIGGKNLPRHSAKKYIPSLEDKPINFT